MNRSHRKPAKFAPQVESFEARVVPATGAEPLGSFRAAILARMADGEGGGGQSGFKLSAFRLKLKESQVGRGADDNFDGPKSRGQSQGSRMFLGANFKGIDGKSGVKFLGGKLVLGPRARLAMLKAAAQQSATPPQPATPPAPQQSAPPPQQSSPPQQVDTATERSIQILPDGPITPMEPPTDTKLPAGDPMASLGQDLNTLHQEYRRFKDDGGQGTFRSSLDGRLQIRGDRVDLNARGTDPVALADALRNLGGKIYGVDSISGTVAAEVPIDTLPALAGQPGLIGAQPVYRPALG